MNRRGLCRASAIGCGDKTLTLSAASDEACSTDVDICSRFCEDRQHRANNILMHTIIILRPIILCVFIATGHAVRPCSPARLYNAPLSAPDLSPKGLLFDIDGTLFDSDPHHYRAFQELLVGYGIVLTEDMFRTQITGRQNAQITAELFPDWTSERRAAFSDAKEARFRDICRDEGLPQIAGLDELFAWIKERRLPRAAVTNAPRVNAEFMLDVIGKRDFFDILVIGDECVNAKPDPEPYIVASRALGVNPTDCVAFEDSPSGATAAATSGAYTFGVLSSATPENLLAVGCQRCIRDYTAPVLWDYLRATVS